MKDPSGARTFLLGGGVIYLVLWLYGVLTTKRSGANFVPPVNEGDYLHLVLGLGMIARGVEGEPPPSAFRRDAHRLASHTAAGSFRPRRRIPMLAPCRPRTRVSSPSAIGFASCRASFNACGSAPSTS